MKIPHFGVALALACVAFFGMAAAITAPADASPHYSIERDMVQPGAALQAPSTEPARDFENTAELTQYQPDGQVSVPWGDWLAELLNLVYAAIAAFVLWLLRKIPKHIVDFLDSVAKMTGQGSANELLEKAIGYGINTTAGAVRGKTLTVPIGNEVLERAVEYALRHAPGLVGKIGGIAGVREKIIARLDLEAAAAIPAPRPPAEALVVSATEAANAPGAANTEHAA